MGWKRNVGIGIGVLFGVSVLSAVMNPSQDKPQSAAEFSAEFIAMPGADNFAMIFAKGADPAAIEQAARNHCYGKQFCKVLGWTDKADAAPRLPMLDREAETLAFSYTLNRNSSYEKTLYSCDQFKNLHADRCLAK